MQGHHAALAEPDQRELLIVEAEPLKLRIEKGVNRPARLDCAVPAVFAAARIVRRRSIRKREPLAAHRGPRGALGRVWRDERRFGHDRAPLASKLDKIVAVSSIAVQE